MTNYAQRTKITLKDIGEPSKVKTLPADQNKFVLGTLVGIATKFVERENATKTEKFEGLGGSFRVIPAADSGTEPLESGVLFIPEAFHNMISENLRQAQVNDEGASLNFAFEVASIRANNPAGYSWELTPLIESTAENPIDKLMALIPALAAPEHREQLTDQRKSKRR